MSLPGWAWVISNRKRLANNMKAFIGLLLNWCVLFLLTGLGGLWDPEKSLVLRWLCSSLSCYMKKIIRNFTTKIKLYHTILSSLYKAILTFLINFVGCLTRSRLLEDLWHTTVYCLSPCTYLGHTTECKSGCGIHGSKFWPKIGKKIIDKQLKTQCMRENALIWLTFSPFHPIAFRSKSIPLLSHMAIHRHHVAMAGNLSHNAIRSLLGQTTPNLLCLHPWRRTDDQRWFLLENLFLHYCMIWKLRWIHPSKE